MHRFPYYKGRPHIPLILEYGNRRERSLPLLDTGADFSIFHRSVSDNLGLDPAQGTLRQFNNADGSIFEVLEFLLSVEIAGARFPARICFANQPALAEFPLLGRLDIFEKFWVTVSEQDQYVEFVPIGTNL